MRVLQYYLAGWHIKPKGVKKPCAVSPSYLRSSPNVSVLCRVDTTPSWANSSDVATTIRMGRMGFTLPNKVRIEFPPDNIPVSNLSYSFTSSTYIRLLLRFTREQGFHRRRAPTKVQVSRQLGLDDDGGREPHHAHGSPRRWR